MDEKALYKITYGLYVVSAQAEGQRSGCVVNTLQQVTAEPVRLAVTVNKESLTCQLIQKAGRFAAVALDQRADMMAIGRFGFRTGKDMDKFEGIPYKEDAAGMPYPTATACAHYSCKVEQTLDLGTHLMFVAWRRSLRSSPRTSLSPMPITGMSSRVLPPRAPLPTRGTSKRNFRKGPHKGGPFLLLIIRRCLA